MCNNQQKEGSIAPADPSTSQTISYNQQEPPTFCVSQL